MKARPIVGEMPRDSEIAQMSSWSGTPIVDAPVLGRAVDGRPVLRRTLVCDREVVGVRYGSSYDGYEVVADV